jgi:hypothetical protein
VRVRPSAAGGVAAGDCDYNLTTIVSTLGAFGRWFSGPAQLIVALTIYSDGLQKWKSGQYRRVVGPEQRLACVCVETNGRCQKEKRTPISARQTESPSHTGDPKAEGASTD